MMELFCSFGCIAHLAARRISVSFASLPRISVGERARSLTDCWADCMPQIPNQVGPILTDIFNLIDDASMTLQMFISFVAIMLRCPLDWKYVFGELRMFVSKNNIPIRYRSTRIRTFKWLFGHMFCVQLVSRPWLNLHHVIKHLINVSNPCKQWIIWHCIN